MPRLPAGEGDSVSDIHITENSLLRIAEQPIVDGPSRWHACVERDLWPPLDSYVIVNERPEQKDRTPISNIRRVTCSACLALLDVALDRGNVRAAIAMLSKPEAAP